MAVPHVVQEEVYTLASKVIKKFEGCKLTAYRCPAGVWTIGYGHTSGVDEWMNITKEQAEEFLRQDMEIAAKKVLAVIKVFITSQEFAALLSFAFNVPTVSFNESTLVKMTNLGSKKELTANQFDKWVYATVNGQKVKLNGLILRREAEKALFLSK